MPELKINTNDVKKITKNYPLKTFRIKTNSIHDYWQLLATALIQLYIYIDEYINK